MRYRGFYLPVAFLLIITMGCAASGTGPISPGARGDSYQCPLGVFDTPTEERAGCDKSVHFPLGFYRLQFDASRGSIEALPDRQVLAHYNITPFLLPPVCGDCLQLAIEDWHPAEGYMLIRATLRNPFPKLTGRDVRMIMDAGVEGYSLGNADGYWELWDFWGEPRNPFVAFAKDEPERRFSPLATHSRLVEFYHPVGELKFSDILITVDASWPDNAEEPYEISSIQVSGALFEDHGAVDVTMEVFDWQDVTAYDVLVEANPVVGTDVHLTPVDATHWETTIVNTGGAPAGEYEMWVAALDETAPDVMYNKFTIQVLPPKPPWSDPILVAGETGVNEILPRLVLQQNDYWIVYTDGTDALARFSTDGGYNWSAPMTVGTYSAIDTIHAVLGGDNGIYVQYQRSYDKYTFLSACKDGAWEPPVSTSYHALTVVPYSCDLGIGADGYLYDMMTGSWSAFGFRSENPYDITSWADDSIEAFYNAVYSVNDGFVQQAATPKFFFVHENTELDYAWYDSGWSKAAAMTGSDNLIEPAIAPESDGPYHGVLGVDRGSDYEVMYFRYNSWPPSSAHTVTLATGIVAEPVFHSISVEGNTVSILYDADGEVRYAESTDGGDTFGSPEVVAGGGGSGGSAYSHVRRDAFAPALVAAYAQEEDGDYNIYVRLRQ